MKAKQVAIRGSSTADKNEIVQTGAEDKVDTACLGCVFAVGKWKEKKEKGKKGQPLHNFIQSTDKCTACYMHTLKKFEDTARLEEMEDQHGNEFWVIHGRVCPFYRPNVWKKDDTLAEASKRVNKEVQVQADLVVYLGEGYDPNDVLKSISAFDNSDIKPAKVYVVNNNCCPPSTMLKTMQKSTLPWRIENVTEANANVGRAIDLIMRKCTKTFVVCVNAGTQLNQTFLRDIDNSLYEDLNRFLMLVPEENPLDGLVTHRPFYLRVGGNTEDYVVNKARRISEDQECQHLIKPLTEIVSQPFVSLSPATITQDMLHMPLPVLEDKTTEA